ncbi:MAG TPA: hypothetical protein PL110_06715 [Candidatus Eremiobacteraeota bacterium]|nr:MAG: hypothetical protein BWY64_02713 [bacterium ADurb.Bin363]HPZ07786.1 hypothetical protein [Candidatus Eremiobacteraeota bacterium]
MKINTGVTPAQLSTTTKVKAEEKGVDPKDGFVQSGGVSEEVVVPKNLVLKAAKENQEVHTPTTMEKAGETADKIGGIIGGAVGLGAVGFGLYSGGLGGLITGGTIGLGFGPAKAIMTGQVGFDIVKTVFSTGGAMAKAGIVLGAGAAAIGAGVIGYKVGKAAGMIPGYAVGIPVGLLSSKEPELVEKPQPKKKHKAGKLATGIAGVVGGTTAIMGGTGGALIGAGIGTAGATVSGLLLKDLTLASLGQGGLLGAAVGGGVMAIAAGYGGYKLVEWAASAINKAKETGEHVINTVTDAAKPKE